MSVCQSLDTQDTQEPDELHQATSQHHSKLIHSINTEEIVFQKLVLSVSDFLGLILKGDMQHNFSRQGWNEGS